MLQTQSLMDEFYVNEYVVCLALSEYFYAGSHNHCLVTD